MTGETPNRTNAEPVRQHIRHLHAAGLTDRRIAALAGLAPETVSGFTRPINRAGNRKGVKRRCHPDVAAKILAVQADSTTPGLVDATGPRRRVQALVAQGWPMEQVARRVGITGNHMRFAMIRARIYGRTAESITRVYNDLQNARPERNGVAKWEADKARKRAAAKRWPKPQYWADRMDVIDDPDFEPLYGVTRREIVAQDAAWVMRTSGLDKAATAQRLGVDKSYIEHAFRDHPQYAVEAAA
jgi:transcriptional regulator with XRE-family HTH domain